MRDAAQRLSGGEKGVQKSADGGSGEIRLVGHRAEIKVRLRRALQPQTKGGGDALLTVAVPADSGPQGQRPGLNLLTAGHDSQKAVLPLAGQLSQGQQGIGVKRIPLPVGQQLVSAEPA